MKSLLGALSVAELNLPRVGPQDAVADGFGSVYGTCVRTDVSPLETTAVAHGGNPRRSALPPQDRTASLLSKTSRM
ncbi:MAG: hypothetical protein F6K56_04875 [Moorea sp. SIO3G5]|nr:hypothetical protein [Moorena sp. SIO3G5]